MLSTISLKLAMHNLDTSHFENSVDPDQLASEKSSHCFPFSLQMHDKNKILQVNWITKGVRALRGYFGPPMR